MVLPVNGINYLVKYTGEPLRIRYYSETIGSVWDDQRTLAQSGNDFYTSGLFLEINSAKASDDAVLMEQGRIKFGDSKLVISGSIPTTSGTVVFTVARSGADIVYEEILPGLFAPLYYGQNAYKMIYVRQQTLGSLT